MAGTDMEEEDLYTPQKPLQRQLEFVDIQEEYITDEQKNLKRELLRAQEEVKRIQSVPLVLGQFIEMVDQKNGIEGSTTGSNFVFFHHLSFAVIQKSITYTQCGKVCLWLVLILSGKRSEFQTWHPTTEH
jgi:ATP-dependent 26S proteasome regulatory subunit